MYTYFLNSTGPEIEINFCQYCDVIVTKNAKALLVHSKTCTQAQRPDRSYNFVCYSCPYHTYKSDHMRDHIMTHTGERPYQCGQCNFRSSRKNSVIVHFRVKHSWRFWKKKKISCDPSLYTQTRTTLGLSGNHWFTHSFTIFSPSSLGLET